MTLVNANFTVGYAVNPRRTAGEKAERSTSARHNESVSLALALYATGGFAINCVNCVGLTIAESGIVVALLRFP